MRALLGLVLVPLTGCVVGPAAVTTVALGPAFIPISAAGNGVAELGAVHAGGDDAHGTQGGWGGSLRSLGIVGKGGPVLMMNGRMEVGAYGRDRIYGFTGLDLGPGYQFGEAGAVGVEIGYRYGGYPQIGHTFPLRVTGFLSAGAFAVHGSLYAGWRIGIRDEYPAATRTLGPWNTWGGDLGIDVGPRQGLALGVTVDREDDIKVVSFHIGGSIRPGK